MNVYANATFLVNRWSEDGHSCDERHDVRNLYHHHECLLQRAFDNPLQLWLRGDKFMNRFGQGPL